MLLKKQIQIGVKLFRRALAVYQSMLAYNNSTIKIKKNEDNRKV